MFVSDWMTKKVYTVEPGNSVSEAVRLMKEKGVKHLPVVKDGKLKGIISDRDIKAYTPSCATSLDIYELHYLLAKTTVREVMQARVFTTAPDTPVEEAAMDMFDMDIGCLPVIGNGVLVGIISDRDLFRVLVDITGVRHRGHRVSAVVEDRSGSIKEVADIIRKYGFSLQSLLTSYEGVAEGSREVVIRCKGAGNFKGLKNELEGTYKGVKIKKG